MSGRALRRSPCCQRPLPLARPEREIRQVEDQAQLAALCADLMARPVIALDVETTIGELKLCLVQIGVPEYSAIIDVRAISDLAPLAAVLETTAVAKVIHHAAFEREVFSQLNISILNVIDTLAVSRRVRGRQPEGHSLAAVCRRELGLRLDKSQQKSDWTRRPLTASQLDYAALDVEILLKIHHRLTAAQSTGSA
ncbi:MAG: ribonuclease D [Myxococcales bacterium]|nr:ribonuclease D [Myxococcales bacterium]